MHDFWSFLIRKMIGPSLRAPLFRTFLKRFEIKTHLAYWLLSLGCSLRDRICLQISRHHLLGGLLHIGLRSGPYLHLRLWHFQTGAYLTD